MDTKEMKILVIDDEVELAQQVCESLKLDGFESKSINNPLLAQETVRDFGPDLIVLDKLMPQKDGVDVLKELRTTPTTSKIPVIMLTACNSKFDKIWAFRTGADDYVSKPFDVDELIERIKAVNRRREPDNQKVIGFNNLEFAINGQFVKVGNTEVSLTATEFNLLRALLESKGKVLSRKDICIQVLGKEFTVERTVDVHIVSLRKKLRHLGDKIQTVRGIGYRLVS